MDFEKYDNLKNGLEAAGWTVGEPGKKGLIDAERGDERLTVALVSGEDPVQLSQAYARLLKAREKNPEIDVAIAIQSGGLGRVRSVKLDPAERLAVGVLLLTADDELVQYSNEEIAVGDVPRGPYGWRNWSAQRSGFSPDQRVEYGLYSDSDFAGTLSDLGPIEVIDAGGRPGPVSVGDAQQVLVARFMWYLPRSSPLIEGHRTKVDDSYFDGGVGDEIAALLSLALNVRCMDGGLIRAWWRPDDLDGLGQPFTFNHRIPALTPPRYKAPMLPGIACDRVALSQAHELLQTYGGLKEKQAVAVVRAARQFQQAIWIADQFPALSWLLLVGALEAAASLPADKKKSLELLREQQPDWAEVLETATHEKKKKVISEAARLSGSTAKVRTLVEKFAPDAPARRPNGPNAIEWHGLTALVMQVYGLRSRAVHAGLPLPAPMLQPAHPVSDPPAERPANMMGTGDSVWRAEDMPMYLSTFADIVGGVLRNWWASLADKKDESGKKDND